MSDITLKPIRSGYNLSKINQNFDTIEEVINEEILHTEGGNNTMNQQLDMDSNRVINLEEPEDGSDASTKNYVDARIGALASGSVDNDSQLRAFLISIGLSGVYGLFSKGFTYTQDTDVGIDDSGNLWLYDGSFPFEVAKGTVPSEPNYSLFKHTDAVGAHDDIYVRTVISDQAIAEDAPVGTRYLINGGRYNVVESSDSGGFYIEGLASGRKLKLMPINGELRSSWVGGFSGDATSKLSVFASISDGLDIVFDTSDTFTLTSEVNFESPKSVDFGETVLNFDRTVSPNPLTIGNKTLTLIHTLTAPLTDIDDEITVNDASGVSKDSVLSIYNPVDFSWSGFRAVYRQGEYLRVLDVSGNTIRFRGKVSDSSYPVGSELYLLPTNKIKVTGSLTVNNVGSYGYCTGLMIFCADTPKLDNLKVHLNEGTHSCQLVKCLDGFGSGMDILQKSSMVSSGSNYGLIYDSCQNFTCSGHFHAERHGVTTGTTGDSGSAINRDILTTGYVTTTGAGSVQAADMHGNSERCGFGGYLEGYIPRGSDSYLVKGTKIVSPALNIAPVQFSEMKNMNHSLRGAVVECEGNPSSRGCIDAGGNSTAFDANTTSGGCLDFTNMIVNGSLATGGAFRIRNRGATGISYSIDFSGTVTNTPNSSFSYVASAVSGDSAKNITFNNDDWTKGVTAGLGVNYTGIKQKGSYTTTLSTSSNQDIQVINFDFDFPSGYIPHVTVQDNKGRVGTAVVNSFPASQSETGFTSAIYSFDNSNFQIAEVVRVTWTAEI